MANAPGVFALKESQFKLQANVTNFKIALSIDNQKFMWKYGAKKQNTKA